MTHYLLRGGRIQPPGVARPLQRDLLIGSNGTIEGVFEPHQTLAAYAVAASPFESPSGLPAVDLTNRLIVPGLVDAHQHLDKVHTLSSAPNPAGTLPGAIAAFRELASTLQASDIVPRAERVLRACNAHGTVALRTHVNVDNELRCRGIEAIVALRDRWQSRLRLQVVAFLTGSGARSVNAAQWLDEAIELGADVVGGTPAIAEDPAAFLDLLFARATRHGLPIDLHLDEHLDASRTHFQAVIDRTRSHGLSGRVVASHCSALSALPADAAHRLIDGFAEAGIGVITLPAANLFLQGRHADHLAPRGLTRVAELAAAGVAIACASDNIHDPFIPTGTGDMLEMARWTLLAGHLGFNDLDRAFAMASATPAQLMGFGDYGIHAGARADLLITEASDAAELVACGTPTRSVIVAGKLVAAPADDPLRGVLATA